MLQPRQRHRIHHRHPETYQQPPPTIDAPAVAPTLPSSQLAARLVLVIDDDAVLRSTVADILQFSGYWTLSAANGQEGLQLFQEHLRHVDVILLDLHMPGMSGLETLRRLRAITPTTRVVLCFGLQESVILDERRWDPALSFLKKPYSLESLLAMLRRTQQYCVRVANPLS